MIPSHTFVQTSVSPYCAQCNMALLDHPNTLVEYPLGCLPEMTMDERQEEPKKITGGKKFDTGKPPMSLLSGAALTEVAKVLEFGAKKYAAHNWKGGFAWSRLASAALRHLFAWIGGEDKDPETGLSHLAHCSCCLMFLLDFEVNRLGTDDRYKAPIVPCDGSCEGNCPNIHEITGK